MTLLESELKVDLEMKENEINGLKEAFIKIKKIIEELE